MSVMEEKEEFDPLRYEAPPGTEVEVQSNQFPDRFYDGYVGEGEKVRVESNGAVFNRKQYTVVGEK